LIDRTAHGRVDRSNAERERAVLSGAMGLHLSGDPDADNRLVLG